VVEIGKAQRIAVEEDRRIVSDQVPVAFLGVELQCSAADVTLGIGGTPFAGDYREPDKTSASACRFRKRSSPW
jgi:hypothetical protein